MSKREWTLNIKDGRITSGNMAIRGSEAVHVIEKTAIDSDLFRLQDENAILRNEVMMTRALYDKLHHEVNELIREYHQSKSHPINDMFYELARKNKGPFKR